MEFTADDKNGFVVFENLSNMTITGQQNGSLITCSPQCSFGLHFKNATNVTLAGLRIRYCSSFIPNYMVDILNKKYTNFNQSTIVIESVKHLTLSGVDIEYSPEFALILIDINAKEYSKDPSFFNLRLSGCTISHNAEGSLILRGKISVLVERTMIAHSYSAINAVNVNMLIKNVDVIQCTISELSEGGTVIIREMLTISNSAIKIYAVTRVYIYPRE